MPRILKQLSPIGFFIPIEPFYCIPYPGCTDLDAVTAPVCEPGVPYEVLAEFIQDIEKSDNGDVFWLGLRPSKDSQSNLDWVELRRTGNYLYQHFTEET